MIKNHHITSDRIASVYISAITMFKCLVLVFMCTAIFTTAAHATPTVNTLTTNNTTPMITGTTGQGTTLGSGDTFTVTLNSVSYTPSSTPAITINTDGTWSFTVTAALTESVYDLVATYTPSGGTALQDTTTNELTIDITNPTLTASTPDSSTTDFPANANIILTFTEPVIAGSGDITIITGVGDIVIDATDTTQVTGVGTNTITINPSSNLGVGANAQIFINASAFIDRAGNVFASQSLSFDVVTATPPPDPSPPDLGTTPDSTTVVAVLTGLIEAQVDMAVDWAYTSANAVANRMSWLRRHRCSEYLLDKDTERRCAEKLSHQGVKIGFADKLVHRFFNAEVKTHSQFSQRWLADRARTLADNNSSGNALTAEVKTALTDHAVHEFAKLKHAALGQYAAFNPTGSINDTWSIWTAGNITLGEYDRHHAAVGGTTRQDSLLQSLSFGLDKYFSDKRYLVGFAVSIGAVDMEIDNNDTKIDSNAYSVSVYSVFEHDHNTAIESIFGIGRIDTDTQRRDSNDVLLTGSRAINQLFASVTFRANFSREGMNFSPYGRAHVSHTRLGGYTEFGSELASGHEQQNIGNAILYAGLDMDTVMSLNKGTLRPFGLIEYGANIGRSSDAEFYYLSVPNTKYSITTDGHTTHHWKFGVGIEYQAKSGAYSSASYERIEAIDSGHADSFNVEFGLEF